MAKENFFAVIDESSLTVYGIGKTEQEAAEDATTWADDVSDLVTVECTKAVFDCVTNDGGQGSFIYDENGVLDVK